MPKMNVKYPLNIIKSPVMEDDSSNVLTVFVFGGISEWWGNNKDSLLRKLKGKKYSGIDLVISSGGGSLSEALVMYDLLVAYPAPVTAYLTGLCASAATIIACAADRVVSSISCMYMVHKPLFEYTGGNATDLRKDALILDEWQTIAVNIYKKKTGMDVAELGILMEDETWISPETAMTLGFVDEVAEVLDIDFDVDGLGGEQRQYFLYDDIYFNAKDKPVFNQAVKMAIEKGYKQKNSLAIEEKPIAENQSDMNAFFQKMIAMFVTAGLMNKENEGKALEMASKAEAPEMLKEMVGEVVAEQLKSVTNSIQKPEPLTATAILGAIEGADEETRKKVVAVISAGADEKINDLSGKVAVLMAGKGGDQGEGNGTFQKEGSEGKVGKEMKATEMSFYQKAYEERTIDAATFKSLTGKEPADRK